MTDSEREALRGLCVSLNVAQCDAIRLLAREPLSARAATGLAGECLLRLRGLAESVRVVELGLWEMARAEGLPCRVVVSVRGGCADVVECPEGVEVRVHDLDNATGCELDMDGFCTDSLCPNSCAVRP